MALENQEERVPAEENPEPAEGKAVSDPSGESAAPDFSEDKTVPSEPADAGQSPGEAAPDFSEDRTVPKRPEQGSEGETLVVARSSEVDDHRVSKIAVESGLVSESEMAACMEALNQVRSVGVSHTLLDVMLDRGVLTSNQAMAVKAAAEAGDEAGLLGGYQLLEKIGEGGMGEVYKAKQLSLDRVVALKVLPDRLARDREFIARFEREAKIAAKLDHQNVVRAIDVGVAAGKHYFVMEFVQGKTIGGILDEQGKIPEKESLDVVVQVVRALDCAWQNNLVHRDIKPDNILLTPDNVVKLADLGLAREVVGTEETRITQAGAVMGTPQYVSPEQATGGEVDIRSDIYSLGATFYHMIVGKPPFSGRNAMEIISARFQGRLTPVKQANPEVSLEVAGIIARMMARDMKQRYPEPRVLLHDLLLVTSGQKPEFASASESSRLRAIEAARSLKTDTTFYYTRPTRAALRIALTVLGAAALITAAWGALSLLTRTDKVEPPPPPLAAALPLAPSAKEVEAARWELRRLIDAGELERAIKRASELTAKLAGGPEVEKLEGLKAEASRKLDQKLRREAEEREKEKRYQSLVSEARKALDAEDYTSALPLLAQARAIRETEEVTRLVERARRLQFIARGEDAERREDLAKAMALYNGALAIEESTELRVHVAELARRMKLKGLSAEADTLYAAEEWKKARDKYAEALEVALEEEEEPLREKLACCGEEVSFLKALEAGEKAAEAEGWENALALAEKALAIKPEEPRALDLEARAKKALGPEKLIRNSIGMELVLVPEGEFLMGAAGTQEDEGPEHKVHLSTFYISKHEVTNTQFAPFNFGHKEKWTRISPADDMPVVCVTWDEANAFCRWLSEKEGARYRLPTEAEWEKAARGTDARVFPWGNALPDDDGYRCNYSPAKGEAGRVKDGYGFVSPVGSFPTGASPYGVLDMAGNVWEWCLDWYAPDYYENSPERDPRGPQTGAWKAMRGASFLNSAGTLRVSNRRPKPLAFFEGNLGFRVVREIESE